MASRATAGAWTGLWIWGSGDIAPHHRNEYVYARKTFTLPAAPKRAIVRVTADNRYQLFANDRFVARGPARCEPKHQSYDELDLAPFLRKGRNVLAALACHYGESTFQSLERGGWGFLLDGEVVCTNGRRIPIHTDASWKARRAESYNRKTSRYSVQLGFQEDFDARRDDIGWTRLGFDDRRWPAAHVYGQASTMPYESFEPRGIPHETEEDREFAAVATPMIGRNHPDYRRHDDIGTLLADETRRPARTPLFVNPSGAIGRGGSMTVRPTRGELFSAIVFDAGREVCGFLELDIEATGGEIVDFFYCEHVRPNGEPVLRARNGLLCPMADRYRCRPGSQRHRFFAWKGFRYVLAVFRDVKRPLKVRRIGYRFTSYPVQWQGAFACGDPLLNRIWEVGAYTQQLCMHDAYIDCPWREQAQWWGDARVQWRVNQAVFGDAALFRRGLRQAAQSQNVHGLTYGLFPCECHGCILPDYTLVWIASIWDYYWYTGDDSPIAEHFDGVQRALGWFQRLAGRDDLLHHPGPGLWLFIDWAPLWKEDCNATFNFQYLEALRLAAKMAEHLGYPEETARYRARADRVERAAVRAFWDGRRKVFYEGYHRTGRRPFRQIAQHANSYAILTNVQPMWHRQIARNALVHILRRHDRLLAGTPLANGYVKGANYAVASPFFYAYVLDAMFRTGFDNEAVAGIRRLWGRMLADGATTWYETWHHGPDRYGNSSACHAWSASPTYHLSEQAGGVTPASPGFARVAIAPKTLGLDWAEVTTPTPRGPIRVAWRHDGKREITGTIRLPKGVHADVNWFGRRCEIDKAGTHKMQG